MTSVPNQWEHHAVTERWYARLDVKQRRKQIMQCHYIRQQHNMRVQKLCASLLFVRLEEIRQLLHPLTLLLLLDFLSNHSSV